MIPVVELIRVSTEGQAGTDRQGIPAQRTTNRDTCARFGLSVVETVEIIESGATVATSAEMARVLDMVTSGRAKGIVLAAYDRLFRPDNWTDFRILQVISEAGASIYVPAGPIDLQTELGFVQASVNNMLAGLERRRIRERTVRAKDEMRRQGKMATGKPAFGMAYDKSAGKWSYTGEIAVVREIFALYLSGRERNYARLAERFALDPTQVRTILRRPVYAGWLIYPARGGRRGGPTGWPPIVPEALDGAIRVETGLPPAVELSDFLEAQRIAQQRSERASLTRASRTDAFLYRGMLECSCSLPIYGIVKNSGHFYGCRSLKKPGRQCGNQHMVRHRVEIGLDRVVHERLTDPALISQAVEAYNDSLKAAWRGMAPSGDAIRRRRKEMEARRARVLEAFFAGLIDRATCDEQIKAIDAQLQAIPTRQQTFAPKALATGDVARMVRVFTRWPRLRWQGRRAILEALAPTFIVHRYEIQGVYMGTDGHTSGGSRMDTGQDTRLWVPLGWAA